MIVTCDIFYPRCKDDNWRGRKQVSLYILSSSASSSSEKFEKVRIPVGSWGVALIYSYVQGDPPLLPFVCSFACKDLAPVSM